MESKLIVVKNYYQAFREDKHVAFFELASPHLVRE